MDGRVAHISANGTRSLFSEQFEDIIKHVPSIGPAVCGYSWSHGWPACWAAALACEYVSKSLRGGCARKTLITHFVVTPFNRLNPSVYPFPTTTTNKMEPLSVDSIPLINVLCF